MDDTQKSYKENKESLDFHNIKTNTNLKDNKSEGEVKQHFKDFEDEDYESIDMGYNSDYNPIDRRR